MNKLLGIVFLGLLCFNTTFAADNIKPFGVKEISVYVGDLNLDVSGSGFTSCRYGTISTTKTYNPPKKKKSGAKKLLEKIFGN